MPRPCKRRRICALPESRSFGPLEGCRAGGRQWVRLTLDEFETIRLIDGEGLTQEACAERMDVARTTVQAIYTSARHKLAHCLVEGKALRIEGGEYELCPGGLSGCGCRCHRGCVNEERNEENETCGHL